MPSLPIVYPAQPICGQSPADQPAQGSDTQISRPETALRTGPRSRWKSRRHRNTLGQQPDLGSTALNKHARRAPSPSVSRRETEMRSSFFSVFRGDLCSLTISSTLLI
ncbi:hypothetical protein ElyMa_005880300 [Elysia marginata]|uniref:Uncharacterized protein n=1 Tax=Elysia marginata TaxID=1093978 RepID=A0AAV4G225_9GAST|nr:hypothetical protein ElyMa_005880300 [Elysia marginata]